MNVSDRLIEKFKEEIQPFRLSGFRRFDKEIDFINKTIDVMDNIEVEADGQKLRTVTKRYHQTPTVEFFWPATWEKKSAELADLLFLLTISDEYVPIERTAMLCQAKHGRRRRSFFDAKWEVPPHQFYLMEELPHFKPIKPKIDTIYSLRPSSNSFCTYAFSSGFWLPFIDSTQGMQENFGYEPLEKYEYTYSRANHPGSTSLYGYMNQFAQGNRGEAFSDHDEFYKFFMDIFQSSTSFPRSKSGRAVPDGGSPEELGARDGASFGVVQIHIHSGDVDVYQLDDGLFHTMME